MFAKDKSRNAPRSFLNSEKDDANTSIKKASWKN